MRQKPITVQALFPALFFLLTGFAHSQVVPAAHQGVAPIEVGGGVSLFNVDWGSSPMIGITAFADLHPRVPARLDGLGIEAEYRIINWRRTVQGPNYKQQTMGGGPIYQRSFHQKYRFYGKFLVDYASMNFTFASDPSYNHDSRLAYVPGGGAYYRLERNLWVRADYEYQIWQPMFAGNKRPTPHGFTVGVAYGLPIFRRH